MIKKIQICNVATYDAVAEELTDLKKINFIYGSNGTGKTTISRVIADCDSHTDCDLAWKGGSPLKLLVYNRDFVEANFNQPEDLKGIFTLGEEDKETLDKIRCTKVELDQIKDKIIQLKVVLEGDLGEGGKRAELEVIETDFEKKCWDLKLKHDKEFQDAFTKVRSKKSAFKEKLLAESESNASPPVELADLEKRAAIVFGSAPQPAIPLSAPNSTDILALEGSAILTKKVLGKSDVDIAALIQKLGNSDWVKQGREFYDPKEAICPFCQQDTPASLEESLNEYFDETFLADTAAIEELYTDYTTAS